MKRRLVLATLLALAVAPTSSAAASRFSAYLGGAESGPSHHFIVGDGLNLVFQDKVHGNTRYHVCIHGPESRCSWGTTAARALQSVIFAAAPQWLGDYSATWSVRGHIVARWQFSIGVGD